MLPQPKSVDVAVNIYGKPYLAAVTLLSLMKQSGQWIDKIYLIEERKQPPGTDLTILKKLIEPFRVIHYRPWMYLGVEDMRVPRRRHLLKFAPFRWSIRYQYAWEKTDKNWLFITHNDVLYNRDLVGAYLRHIGEGIGIGKVGQCWNCPAYKEQRCDGDRYRQYQPTEQEVVDLYARQGDARGGAFRRQLKDQGAWPLPECRLNEYACLINLEKARPQTKPYGTAQAFGFLGHIDTASDWFSDVSHQGNAVINFDYDPYAAHSWVNGINNGHRALSDRGIYDQEEQQAYALLQSEFGFTDEQLGQTA